MNDIDCSEGGGQKVLDVLSSLNDLAVRMAVTGESDMDEDSDVASFIQVLKSKTNVHYYPAS